MAKFTQERREIRDRRLHLQEMLETHARVVRSIEAELRELQRSCPHPAGNGGNFLGMSTWYCPDCGEGN